MGPVLSQPIVDEWSGDCANPALPIPAAARVVVKVRPTSMGRKTARFSLCLVSLSLSSPSPYCISCGVSTVGKRGKAEEELDFLTAEG